jgi:hypothetical protein
MSAGEGAGGGNENMNNAVSPRIMGALQYPAAEGRNVTVQPNQPRQPHNLQDLLRFSVEATTTGHSASNQNNSQFVLGPMDEEVSGFH